MRRNILGTLLAVLLLGGSFLAGAFWAWKKLWPYDLLRDRAPTGEVSSRRTIATDNVALSQYTFSVAAQTPIHPYGGGIDAFDDNVLIMSVRGEFYVYERKGQDRSIARLDIVLDNGYDAFLKYAATRNIAVDPAKNFRFIDIVYEQESSPHRVLASHHQWHESDSCFTIRLSRLDLDATRPLSEQSAVSKDWTTAYDTQPCLSVVADVQVFAGDQSGGRIVQEGPSTVLLSVGDQAFDGWTHGDDFSQDSGNDYGKILRVTLDDGSATHVSIGHRNPQGLAIDDSQAIWSTEHGPRGGDELNLIREGGNYGWPIVTYGSAYGMYRWPMSKEQNRHDGYDRPIIAWSPSIGPSNLIQVHRFMPEWEGDLLIGSLRDKSLHRIRYRDGRAVFDHRIELGVRIRDLDQWDDGTIIIWTDEASILELTPSSSGGPDLNQLVATLEQGKRQQALGILSMCLQCHGASPGADFSVAPNLWGVYGRRIASTSFAGYSQSLKRQSGNWDEQTLNAFLRDIDGFANGSTMAFPGVRDDAIRAVIIRFLRDLKEDGKD